MESKQPKKRFGNVKFVEPYDFKHPKLFSKEIMRTLRSIHDNLARNLGRIFSSSLRYKVDVHLQKIDQLSSSKFIQELDSPSTIYLLDIQELGGELILVLPPELCIHFIERQSGGQGKELADRRTLTTIEEKIVSRIMQNVNQEIIMAWEPFMDFSIGSMTYESKPENIHLTTVDPTIVAKFKVDLGEKELEIKITYSYSLLKEAMNDTILKKGLKSKLEKLSDEELDSYKRTLSKAKVCVQSLLGETSLTLKDIMNLKEGDTIPLPQKADKPLEVRVNGVKKLTAYPGMLHGRRAIKVFELLEEINEQELV
ncbi:MAG: hypothetical protein FH748_00765 [Balneolaceae bacterium]|nr:hypothetical protein [Balneolaceae bacterium]